MKVKAPTIVYGVTMHISAHILSADGKPKPEVLAHGDDRLLRLHGMSAERLTSLIDHLNAFIEETRP